MKIRGLSFSLKRAVGISEIKRKVAVATGVPTTRQGFQRKVGALVLRFLGKIFQK